MLLIYRWLSGIIAIRFHFPTILKEDRPYELRDVDGTPVTVERARAIIAERYTVSKEVRHRNNQRTRRERAERRAERKAERESRASQ